MYMYVLFLQLLSAYISSSACVTASKGRPPPSGERGRKEKNYHRNQAKKERSRAARGAKAVDMQSLLKDIKKTDDQSKDGTKTLK